ncbi:MAG: hypothetical protein AB9842_07960 [Bacteroidales bacterium]
MGLLGKPNGIFSLRDSDNNVGSYISKEDVSAILNVPQDDLCNLSFKRVVDYEVIDESSLRASWESNKIPSAPAYKMGNSRISLDEYILVAIIKLAYGESIQIQQQYPWGKKYVDIKVDLPDKSFFIEFHGPGHFIQMSARPPEDPFIRKRKIEEEFGVECYIWPYWIQRCARNLRILIGEINDNGRGALWSTKMHFGQFCFHNSSEIIANITSQFRAASDGIYGYFYDEWRNEVLKPEHPIVEKIIQHPEKKLYLDLIPRDLPHEMIKNWLPSRLI